jgi:peptidylprolyl isomerase
MTEAKMGDTVRVHYTGTLDDGTTFDSSAGREPLEFTLGEGMVIPGFETTVEGMAPGTKRKQRIEPADAYGDRDEERVIQMPRSELPPDATVAVGDRVRLQDEMGHVHAARISDLGLETLTLDFNHELAGQALTFEIELVEIG